MTEELPLLWDTTAAPSAFDPADWIDYAARRSGRPRPTLPDGVVLSLMRAHVDLVRERTGAEPDDFTGGGHPLAVLAHAGDEVGFCYSAKGSYAAGAIDELVELGARRVVVLGGAGSLVEELPIGQLLVPTKALRDEGVSFHYEPPSRYSFPSERLSQALVAAAEARSAAITAAPVWTTTAHFRLALPRLEAFRDEGCVAINNEASIAFSVGRHRGIEVAFLLLIGDSLAGGRFRAPEGDGWLYGVDERALLLDLACDALLSTKGCS